MVIPFRGKYQKKQVIRAFYQLVRPKKGQIIPAYIILTFFIGAFVYNLFLFQRTADIDNQNGEILLRYLVLFPVILYFTFGSQIKVRSKAIKNWQVLEKFGEISGYVNDRGITFRSIQHTENCIPWKIFIKKAVSEDVISLLESGGSAIILPKEFFESDRDWLQAAERVRNSVNEIIIDQ